MRMAAGLCALILTALSTAGIAATIQRITPPTVSSSSGGVPLFWVGGEFTDDDKKQFEDVVGNESTGIVFFDSPGGSVATGLWIGSTIRTHGFSTSVPPGKVCASACALAWLGGKHRYLSPSSKVGFHAAYRSADHQESGMANAVVGAYLSELGLPIPAIEYATAASPDSMEWLTLDQAKNVGIDVVALDDDGNILAESSPFKVPESGFRDIARRAVKAFRDEMTKSGMSGLTDVVNACYARAQKLMKVNALAYCYIIDRLANAIDTQASSQNGWPPDAFFFIERVNARTDRIFDLLDYDVNKRRSYTDTWDRVGAAALKSAF